MDKIKIALVYDRINKWGGAERILLQLHDIWPEAPIYSAVYNPKRAVWAKKFRIVTSFLQHFPLAKRFHEFYPWLTPLAFESFNFDEFDIVLSVTSAEAKSIITKPKTCHICYCLTPTRYLWSGRSRYQENPGMGIFSPLASYMQKLFIKPLRRWDLYSSSRPDYYLAISRRVSDRINKFYHKQTEKVIYPPVNTAKFNLSEISSRSQDYYLVVSRLVSYKRVDIIIEAFNRLGWPLVIIGDGWQKKELMNKAKNNIKFAGGDLTDEEVVRYHQNCRALIHAADEDFGIVALEAQACGKAVIAFKFSGIAEIVVENKTGILFDQQNAESLIKALKIFNQTEIAPADCRKNALKYSDLKFKSDIKSEITDIYRRYQNL